MRRFTRYIPPPSRWPEIAVWLVVLTLVLAAVYCGLTTALNQ